MSESHFMRNSILKAGFVLGCTAAGAGTAAFSPTAVTIGPHEATAELTLGNESVIDFGPAGRLSLPDTSSLGIGGKIDVGEIPSSLDVPPLDNAGNLITQYQQLLADPEQTVENIRHSVVEHIQEGAQSGGIAGIGLLIGAHIAARTMRPERRQAFRTAFSPNITPRSRRIATASAMSAAVLVACSSSSLQPTHEDRGTLAHVFDGTPLEGARIHGEILRLALNAAAPRIVSFIKETEEFYAGVESNFRESFERSAIADQLPEGDNVVVFQHISDNHCNIGMDVVHGAIAEAFGVHFTIDSGDSTMSGTAAEAECINSEANAINNPILWVRGNHDSDETTRQAGENDMLILDNAETVEIEGLTVMGMGDPRYSEFGSQIEQRGEATIDDHAAFIEETACELESNGNRPDILVTHSPAAAIPTIESGCAGLSVSGHSHRVGGPNMLNPAGSLQFTQGSSGGARNGGITLGTLKAPAEQTVFFYDKEADRLLGYVHITAMPDMSVVISDYQEIVMPGPGLVRGFDLDEIILD